MFIRQLLSIAVLLLLSVAAQAQCTTLGQTPQTAFPVCGSSTFTQTSVPACVNGNMTVPCNSGTASYQDLNPYWYKFTCFESGTLQLTINPKNSGDDYDWQLFDVTGVDISRVYGDASLLVACNWSGLPGTTGTRSNAASLTECASTGTYDPPIFSKLPDLIKGHNYLLMISHFSGNQQSGYDLSFTGGTASITDTVAPALLGVEPNCDGSRIFIYLNKKMKCKTLTASGSDWLVSGTPVGIASAHSSSCNTGFDMDTIVLMMAGPLGPGSYTVKAQMGSDGDGILDNCDQDLPPGSSASFTIATPVPVPPDSLLAPQCAPNTLTIVLPRKIHCNTIAADGSDFNVTGPTAVTVTGASAVCDEFGESKQVIVQLSAPIQTQGNYVLHLKVGVDGNSLVDDCGLPILNGPGLPFSTKDTVDAAAYQADVHLGCINDTIQFSYPNINQVDTWTWAFEHTDTSHEQSPRRLYKVFNTKTVYLSVSNGFCTDTATGVVVLDNAIDAAFEAPNIMCPEDLAAFKNSSSGKISSWDWSFGDGKSDGTETPPDHLYPKTGIETKYSVRLIVGNGGCYDTAKQVIDVLKSCYIAVPTAFTPNGDGLNDYLYPLNAYKADNLLFRVYNRYGQLVFTGRGWLDKWDGRINGNAQPPGVFVWSLEYTDRDTGKKFFQKGTSVLIR